jgi:hypothetical protein
MCTVVGLNMLYKAKKCMGFLAFPIPFTPHTKYIHFHVNKHVLCPSCNTWIVKQWEIFEADENRTVNVTLSKHAHTQAFYMITWQSPTEMAPHITIYRENDDKDSVILSLTILWIYLLCDFRQLRKLECGHVWTGLRSLYVKELL